MIRVPGGTWISVVTYLSNHTALFDDFICRHPAGHWSADTYNTGWVWTFPGVTVRTVTLLYVQPAITAAMQAAASNPALFI
jgi:hypothetical protein